VRFFVRAGRGRFNALLSVTNVFIFFCSNNSKDKKTYELRRSIKCDLNRIHQLKKEGRNKMDGGGYQFNSLYIGSRPVAYAGPKQIVYEGQGGHLEGSCNLDQPRQFENTRTATFVAPYVSFDPRRSDNKTYSCLVFKVVATDKRANLKSEPSFVTVIVKMIHRALVLQGGGSLGAYNISDNGSVSITGFRSC